ncbi:MAG: nucleotidyltransferase family protein, partial [Desulfuromonadales bacterium]|nr:nucleotidyltransferase family protein [Desulfuromonadales bacterium]
VQALAQIGVDTLCFGSEAGKLDILRACAELLDYHRAEIEAATSRRLREGENYPTARAEIIAGLSGNPALSAVLAAPNNILGIEYLRALSKKAPAMTPDTIRRIGAGYHDLAATGEIASATGIRHMLAAGEAVSQLVPEPCLELLADAMAEGLTPADDILFRLIVQALQRVEHLPS